MKALLIIDIQNDYFDGGTMTLSGSLEASLNTKLILEKFREDNLPIVHIQHLAADPAAGFFLPNTEGAKIHENVKPVENEKVIQKYYPNSFRETDLLDHLKKLNINELIICGMMTHMCVDATTRAAKDFEFDCTVIGNACATRDLEIFGEVVKASEIQKAFLSALEFFYSRVITTDEYLNN